MAKLTKITLNDQPDVRVINNNFQTTENMINDVQLMAETADNKADTEKNRAETAELSLTRGLTEEVARAQTEEQTLSNNITRLETNKLDKAIGIQAIEKVYELPTNPDENTLYILTERGYEGLKFTPANDGTKIGYQINGDLPNIDIEYSLDDGKTWVSWDGSEVEINIGEYLCVRNNANTLSENGAYFNFTSSHSSLDPDVLVSGSVMSMINNSSLTEYCFANLFNMMNIVTAPDLPATTLAPYCYYYMFGECRKLVTAPDLPATTLEAHCYEGLFYICSQLDYIKLSYTGNFSAEYFDSWVSGVASSGTFYYNGSDTTQSVSAIPSGWYIQTF